tara:strand:+ start:81 stop:488 length:408 start_codon:yes stop_codon:yes gene_type:complete
MSNIISIDAFNNKAVKHEEDTFIQEREHWDNLRNDLGYETILDLQDAGMMPLDKKIFKDKPYVVNYKCIKEMGATFDDTIWITFTAVAKNGTVGELWKAAETCYQQAKLAVGDWHTFIEDFNMEDDGSFSLVTGS